MRFSLSHPNTRKKKESPRTKTATTIKNKKYTKYSPPTKPRIKQKLNLEPNDNKVKDSVKVKCVHKVEGMFHWFQLFIILAIVIYPISGQNY